MGDARVAAPIETAPPPVFDTSWYSARAARNKRVAGPKGMSHSTSDMGSCEGFGQDSALSW